MKGIYLKSNVTSRKLRGYSKQYVMLIIEEMYYKIMGVGKMCISKENIQILKFIIFRAADMKFII